MHNSRRLINRLPITDEKVERTELNQALGRAKTKMNNEVKDGRRVKFLIDFIPVRTVSNEFAGNRGRCRLINFVQGNEKPFAMEPLFDCFDFFSFHIIHLICKYILRAGESQREKRAIPLLRPCHCRLVENHFRSSY